MKLKINWDVAGFFLCFVIVDLVCESLRGHSHPWWAYLVSSVLVTTLYYFTSFIPKNKKVDTEV